MIANRSARQDKPARILLILGENRRWSQARSWPYNLHLGFEAALRASGAEVLTVTTIWFTHLAALCANQRFDQVWVVDQLLQRGDGRQRR